MAHDQVRSLRNQGWAWFDYAVLDEYGPTIKAEGIAVYMVLARHADNNTQQSFPAVATIAEKINMSERQVKRILKRLADEGLITITAQHDPAGRQLSNLYTLQPVLKMSYRGDTQSPSGVTTSPGGGDTQSPKQDSVNNTHRNKRETGAPAPAQVDIPRNSSSGASREMAPGTPVNKRPDAPKVQPRPIKQPLPVDFAVSAEQEHWAQTTVPTLLRRLDGGARLLDLETEKFRAHYEGTGEQQAAWAPMWRKWMLMSVVNYPPAVLKPTASPAPKAPQYFAKRG
jgi:predicted transcriptional regulator